MFRWIVLAISLLAAVPAAAQGLQTFTSDGGGLSFRYPAGWQVITTDRQVSRYVENYAVQPPGQDFAGRPGQVAIRIFDPMYVVEEARARQPLGSEAVFQQFVRALPGGANATFGRRTYGGATYFFASEGSEGFETDYAAVISSAGYLNVAAMAVSPQDAAQRLPLLLQTVSSISAPWPGQSPDGAAAAVSNWYRILRAGNARALVPLACSEAQGPLLLLSFASPSAMDTMVRAAYGFDFSGLRFQTVGSGSRGAAVRIGGNITAVNGAVTPAYRNAGILGGSNMLFVKLEDGAWKVCGPIRGSTR